MDIIEKYADKAFEIWKNGDVECQFESAKQISQKHLDAIVAICFNGQVCNGGFCQWVDNGYASSSIEFLIDLLERMETKNSNKILRMVRQLAEYINVEKKNIGFGGNYWENPCPYCNGEGFDTEDDEYEECHECNGTGYIVPDLDKMDDTYYEINEKWMEEVNDYLNDVQLNVDTDIYDEETASQDKNGVKYPNVTVKLIGEDGNAFLIIGKVKTALRRNKVPTEEIDKYMEEAMNGDYNNLLATTMKWVKVA